MTHARRETLEAASFPCDPGPRRRRLGWVPLWAVLAVACGDYGGGSSGPALPNFTPGGGSGAPSTEQVAAFAQTTQPLLRSRCASCHAGAGPGTPHIAHTDPDTAYHAVVDNQKVDLGAPERSRLVRRLAVDFHHCWSNCIMDAAEMQASVASWAALIDTSGGGTQVEGIVSESLTFGDGIEDEGQDRYVENLIALYEFREGDGEIAHDTSGVFPAMDLSLEDTEWMSNYGLIFEGGSARSSREASRKLYDHIANPDGGTQQYSVEAWLIPANTDQEGPARILTYSNGTGARNFTLGQVLYYYNFRNRSLAPEVDANGRPALQTSDADQDLRATLQHVVLTYDQYRGRRIYVDGAFTDDLDEVGPGRLWSWDPEHVFLLGNEASRNRPWDGRIQLLAIYEYALTDPQILQNFGAGVGRRVLMRFDVSRWGLPGSYIEFVVSELDDASYLFCQPTFVAPSAPGFRLTNMRVAVNGQIPVSGQGFVNVDAVLLQARQELSPGCSVILKSDGPATDVFTLEFEYLGEFEDPIVPPPPPPPPTPVFGDALPVEGVRSFDRVNESMAAVTGVDPNTASVRATFDAIEQQLPPGADLRSFSASQQVAISKLALEYCDALVESPALREAFFGTSPPFDFDSPAIQVFADSAQRGLLADRLVNRMFSNNVSYQPNPTEVEPLLNALVDDLILGCDATSCGPDRTRTVVKATCAAVLASAGVAVH